MRNINSFLNGVLISICLFIIWLFMGYIARESNYLLFLGSSAFKIFEIINILIGWLIFLFIMYLKRNKPARNIILFPIILYLLSITILQVLLPPSISPMIN